MPGTKRKNCYIQRVGKFLTYTRNCKQKANIAVVKSTLKIPTRHNGIISMKIKGHVIKGHTAYFISNQDSKKGKDPNIHIIDGIHNIKGKNICQCTHLKLHQQTHHFQQRRICRTSGTNKKKYNILQQIQIYLQTTVSPWKEWWPKKVEPDTFKPPHHKLKKDIGTKLEELLQEYQSQFSQDETTIGTTPLTKMTIDTRNFWTSFTEASK